MLSRAVSASALLELSGYSDLGANRMEPDMRKTEAATIQWLNMGTLMRLLATSPDEKTKTKPALAGIGAGGRRGVRGPSSATPRMTSRAKVNAPAQ
jgi:hypothetical protein